MPVGDPNSDAIVGYVKLSDIRQRPDEYRKDVNARTLWDVTDAEGTVVGYMAPDVPFVSLADAHAPGFDVEKLRADHYGGCEPQVGDPSFVQEFPLCDTGDSGG
jgi:hypothetical protein